MMVGVSEQKTQSDNPTVRPIVSKKQPSLGTYSTMRGQPKIPKHLKKSCNWKTGATKVIWIKHIPYGRIKLLILLVVSL